MLVALWGRNRKCKRGWRSRDRLGNYSKIEETAVIGMGKRSYSRDFFFNGIEMTDLGKQ